jgi:DNA-binding CsgD family transcriptional regulator
MGGAASQHENELVLDVLSIAEPAFAVNDRRQIVAWNDAAERLLGIAARDIMGARCDEALNALDGALCAQCDGCPAGELFAKRALTGTEALVSPACQPDRRLRLTALSARTTQGQSRIVHLLREERPGEQRQDAASPIARGSKQPHPLTLTQRELEVLRLLGAGHSTADIAGELSIARVTARNHVNKVLDKLGASSRLQAVVIASQLRLI